MNTFLKQTNSHFKNKTHSFNYDLSLSFSHSLILSLSHTSYMYNTGIQKTSTNNNNDEFIKQ